MPNLVAMGQSHSDLQSLKGRVTREAEKTAFKVPADHKVLDTIYAVTMQPIYT